jgi:riboflavin synthase
MFTGIIEELGKIEQVKTVKDSQQLTINATEIMKDIRLGDSIAVNGVCLTVTNFTDKVFTVDVMPETYSTTSLAFVKVGAIVNLERAIAVGGRLGGHFVTGHVDGVGTIIEINKNNNAINYQIKLPQELLKLCLFKGSIAIDGTSLTIFAIDDNSIRLSLIPHTVKNTVLGTRVIGDIVNIECDMLGKYVLQLLQNNTHENDKSIINSEFLKQQGFL